MAQTLPCTRLQQYCLYHVQTCRRVVCGCCAIELHLLTTLYAFVQMHADTLLYIEDSHCQTRLACALDPTQFTCGCRVTEPNTCPPAVHVLPTVYCPLALLQGGCRSSPSLHATCCMPCAVASRRLFARLSCIHEPCAVSKQFNSTSEHNRPCMQVQSGCLGQVGQCTLPAPRQP